MLGVVGSGTTKKKKNTGLKTRHYKREGPMCDRALRFFADCTDGYLAAAMDLAS